MSGLHTLLKSARADIACSKKPHSKQMILKGAKRIARVLRAIMDYGYEHERPAHVRLVCADEVVYKAYSFQWNMWFAERKPEHENEA